MASAPEDLLSAHPQRQRPDNYDFASTRAINAPVTHLTHENKPITEDLDDKKQSASPYTQSISEEPAEENDLDPVSLGKAFKFAARSSVALVIVCATYTFNRY